MTDSILTKLQSLEKLLSDVQHQYHQNLKELNTLKAQPKASILEFNQIKLAFDEMKKEQANLEQERNTLQAKLDSIEDNYQSLQSSHDRIVEEQQNLIEQVAKLTHANDKLQQKNRIAAEHTQVVLQRLTQIDQS